MPKGIRDIFWENEDTAELFRTLCKKAESRPLIKWKKFRKFDKEGIFAEVSNAQLCSTYRKMYLKDLGICPKCGKYYLEDDQEVCSICIDKNKKYVADFFKRKKLNAK
jgi:hypothetical protein